MAENGQIEDRAEALRSELDEVIARAETEKRELTEDEAKRFDAATAELEGIVKAREAEAEETAKREAAVADALKQRQAAVEALKARMVPAARTASGVTVGREESVYRKDGNNSFFRDLWRSQSGDFAAQERLARNTAERTNNRALSTVNGGIGEFVPPVWLEQDFVKLARPGRPFANAVHHQALPAGTDAINIPVVTGGTQMAIQGNQNTAINIKDMTTSSIAASVTTIAGGQTMSLQLIEQSPLNIDQMVLQDLAADYGRFLDTYLLSDATVGVLGVGQQVAVTGTATGNAAAQAIYKGVATAISNLATARQASPDLIVMAPRRWYWLVSQFDTNGRPLVVPNTVAQNPLAASGFNNEAQGVVGTMLGLPVMLDSSMPVNLGTGTNQDAILVVKSDDLWLFESSLRAQVFPETYAQNLSVFARMYNYVAFTAKRYAASVQVVGGTQLNVLS